MSCRTTLLAVETLCCRKNSVTVSKLSSASSINSNHHSANAGSAARAITLSRNEVTKTPILTPVSRMALMGVYEARTNRLRRLGVGPQLCLHVFPVRPLDKQKNRKPSGIRLMYLISNSTKKCLYSESPSDESAPTSAVSAPLTARLVFTFDRLTRSFSPTNSIKARWPASPSRGFASLTILV